MQKHIIFLLMTLCCSFVQLKAQKEPKLKLALPIGHTNFVNTAQFSPACPDDPIGGKRVVTASSDNTAKIWDVGSGKLLMDLNLHKGTVYSARFSPDGKKVVTVSTDKTAKIWEVESGNLLFDLIGHTSNVISVEFSPACPSDPIGGEKVVTTSWDNTAKIWDVKTGTLLFDLKGHTKTVFSAQFSPDGKKIVTESGDSTAKIWSVENGKLLVDLRGHTSEFTSVQFSPACPDDPIGGKKIATSSWDNTPKIWNAASGILLFDLIGHTGPVFSINFSPDGKNVITASRDSTVKIWDVESGKLLADFKGHINQVDFAQFGPDGKQIVTFSKDNTAKIWDVSGKKLLADLKGHTGSIYSLEFSPDGKKIITSSVDHTAKIWEVETGKLLVDLYGHTSKVRSVLLSPDGKKIVTTAEENRAKVWDAERGTLLFNLNGHKEWITSVHFSPDQKKIATSSLDSTAKIWSAESGQLLTNLYGHTKGVKSVQFSPACSDDPVGGKKIATGSYDKTAKIWDAANGQLLIDLVGHKGWVLSARFSPDGKKIVTDNWDNVAQIWEVESGKLLVDLVRLDETLVSAHFSPDGKKVMTPSEGYTAVIWDVESGKRIYNLIGHTDLIDYIDFSPDGKKAATSSCDKTAKIWDVSNGKLLFDLKGHSSCVYKVKFSPACPDDPSGGKKAVTTSDDRTARIWDVENGQLLVTLSGHTDMVNEALFTPDGKKIVTVSADTKCKLWDVATGKELLTWMAIDSNDYVVIHPSGLFDASQGAMEKMYWVKGLEVIDLNQLKVRYWEPGLWEKVMKGEPLRDVQGMNELKLQPEVNLADITNGKLPITLTKRDGGYGRVVILINGKEVEADARGNGFDTTKTQQTIVFDIKNSPLLTKGKANTITVKAWSADGFVEGRGAEMIYIPEGDTLTNPPSFYAVVLGVSDYSTNAIHLKYAQPDATAMAASIKIGAENLFGKDKTFIYALTSPGETKPTKENIRKVFQEIKTKAKPNDILMLYMSGHGITWGGESGDFYYLTADAFSSGTEAYNDPAIREKNTISTLEFTQWIKEIPALKQLMIIDACGSGKAVDNLIAQRNIEGSQVKAIDRMKDRTGMYIISGCAADAVSYEASRYGQGLLTYTILQAMKGAALREDKFIDVNTLLNYAREEVPKLAAGIGGIQQPQLLIPKGGSFDIGIIEAVDRSKIILSSPKQMFVRSLFMDAEQMDDVLGLSVAVDDALNALSAKGNESPIIFLDTRNYPDGCRITGNYTQKNGKIFLKYKIKCGDKVGEYQVESGTVEEVVKEITLKASNIKN